MGSSVELVAVFAPSVIEEIDGTEGPGAGVDCVTVVIARPWVVLTGLVVAVAVVVGVSSALLVVVVPSSVCCAAPSEVSMLQVAVVAVLVVPVSCVSQGGLEQTLWTSPDAVLVWSAPILEVVVDAVLVVPVSWVSHGGLEQTL